MDNFLNSLVNTMESEIKFTENGAEAYATTGKKLLDMNFAVSSLRNASESEIVDMFTKVFYEDKLLALKWLFYASDVRQGLGERRLFRVVYGNIAKTNPEIALALMELVPEYSRWDNIFMLSETKIANDLYEYVCNQLCADMNNMHNGNPVSLLAKWMPSVNTSSFATRQIAKRFVKHLGTTDRDYRKMLSSLRKYLDVVEVKMSANEWSEIDYSNVPSKANVKYNDAFWKHDAERREAFINRVANGEEKINAGVLFPHDIIHNYTYNWRRPKEFDPALEELWKALPDYVDGNGKTLVIRDGSGSMTDTIGGTTTTALEVATALTIYFASRQSGCLKDKFITFSANPQFVDMSNAKTLHDKLVLCSSYTDCSNTNMEKTLQLLLDTAVNGNLSPEDMPKNLLIVSDMEFDCACRFDGNLFEEFAEKFAEFGYKLPRLVFWNVMSRSGAIPVKENEMGAALVSGFSPVICNMVLSDELDPLKCLLNVLNGERYDAIEKALGGCL